MDFSSRSGERGIPCGHSYIEAWAPRLEGQMVMEDRTGHLVLAEVRQVFEGSGAWDSPWGPGEREKWLSQCPIAQRAGGSGDPACQAPSTGSVLTPG